MNNKKTKILLTSATAVLASVVSLNTLASTEQVYYSKTYQGGDKSKFGYRVYLKAGNILRATDSELYAEGRAYGQAFGKEKEVAGLDGKNTVKKNTHQGEATLEVRLLGKKLLDKKYSYKTEFGQPDDSWIKEVKFASATFSVGPVPVTVSAGASLEAKPRFYARYNQTATPHIHFQAGPDVDLAVTASAEAGISNIAAVGVKNSLSLYDGALLAEAAIYPIQRGIRTQLVHERTGIHGRLKAYVELLFTDHSKTIATYGDSTRKRSVLWGKTWGDIGKTINGTVPTAMPALVDVDKYRVYKTFPSFNPTGSTMTRTQSFTVPSGVSSAKVRISAAGRTMPSYARPSLKVYNSRNQVVATISGGYSKTVNLSSGSYRVVATVPHYANFEFDSPHEMPSTMHVYWNYNVTETTTMASTGGSTGGGTRPPFDDCGPNYCP